MQDAPYRLIPVKHRDEEIWTKVSPEDYEALAAFNWFLSTHGYVVRNAGGRLNYRQVKMHREVLGLAPGDGWLADHINRDRIDNRRSNLRRVTPVENGRNISNQTGCSSRYRGVTWNKDRSKWCAQAKFARQKYHLGLFLAEIDAARAANAFWVERGYPAPNEV